MNPQHSIIIQLRNALKIQMENLSQQRELSYNIQDSLLITKSKLKPKSPLITEKSLRSSKSNFMPRKGISGKLMNMLGNKTLKTGNLKSYIYTDRIMDNSSVINQIRNSEFVSHQIETEKEETQVRELSGKKPLKPLDPIISRFRVRNFDMMGMNSLSRNSSRNFSKASRSIEKAKNILNNANRQRRRVNDIQKFNLKSSRNMDSKKIDLKKNLSLANLKNKIRREKEEETNKTSLITKNLSKNRSTGNFKEILLTILNKRKSSAKKKKDSKRPKIVIDDIKKKGRMIQEKISFKSRKDINNNNNNSKDVMNIFQNNRISDRRVDMNKNSETIKRFQFISNGEENKSRNRRKTLFDNYRQRSKINQQLKEDNIDLKHIENVFDINNDSYEEYDI